MKVIKNRENSGRKLNKIKKSTKNHTFCLLNRFFFLHLQRKYDKSYSDEYRTNH